MRSADETMVSSAGLRRGPDQEQGRGPAHHQEHREHHYQHKVALF